MAQERRYAYVYAVIDLDTGMCFMVEDTTNYMDPVEYPDYIEIPEYNEEYLMKYYNRADGNWYTDPEFTIPLVL